MVIEKNFWNILDNMMEGFQVIDYKWRYIYVNDAVAKHGHTTKEKLLGKTMMEAYPGIEKTKMFSVLTRCMKERVPAHMENEFSYPNGEKGWFELSIQPVPEGIFILSINITERKRAEEKLKQSEEQYRTLFENTGTAMCILEDDKTISMVNRRFEELSGYSWKELEGKKWTELVTKEYLEQMKRYHEARRKKGGKAPTHYNFDFVNRKGQTKNGLLTINLIPETKNSVASIIDITEQKKAEEALRKSEHYLRKAQQIAHFGSWVLDVKTNRIEFSDEMFNIFGITKEQFNGTTDYTNNLVQPEDRARVQKCYEDLLIRHKPVSMEYSIIRPDGSVRHLWGNGEVEFDEKGNLQYLVGTVLDITERKQTEEMLRESEKEKSAVLDNMSELVIHQDLKHRILWVNKKAADSLNMKAEQLKGRYCYEIWAKRADPCAACPLEESKKTGQPQQGEITTPDGRVWYISCYQLKDANGNPTSIVEVVTNITEQKKAEEALRESEEKYRELINGMNDTAWVIDLDGKIIDVNDAAVKVTGYSREELLSMGLQDIDSGLDYEKIIGLVKGMPSDEIPVFETTHTTKYGETIPVEISSSLITYMGKQAILSIARNITERKQIEQQLKESEEKYRKQFENAMDAIVLADAETGIIVDCNRAATKLVGRKKSELVGKHQRILHPPEEIKGKFSTTFKQHRKEKEGQLLETHVITKTGEIRDVAIKANILELGDKKLLQGIFRDITEQKKAEQEMRDLSYRLNGITPGECYISGSEKKLMKVFAYSVVYGRPGFCITRKNPETLTEKYSLKPEHIRLLSSTPIKGFHVLSNLQEVSLEISKFLKNGSGIVLLAGLEYLVSRFGFNPVYSMLQEKRFDFLGADAVLLVPVNFEALTNQQKALLASEFKTIK
jgi:PAS domain S-box-containing protein